MSQDWTLLSQKVRFKAKDCTLTQEGKSLESQEMCIFFLISKSICPTPVMCGIWSFDTYKLHTNWNKNCILCFCAERNIFHFWKFILIPRRGGGDLSGKKMVKTSYGWKIWLSVSPVHPSEQFLPFTVFELFFRFVSSRKLIQCKWFLSTENQVNCVWWSIANG